MKLHSLLCFGLLTLTPLGGAQAEPEVQPIALGVDPVVIWPKPGISPLFPSLTQTATALVKCALMQNNDRLDLSKCIVLKEEPEGKGVGDRAAGVANTLHLSAAKNPGRKTGDEILVPLVFATPQDRQGLFGALTKLPAQIERPGFVDKPTPDELQKYFPDRAFHLNASGEVKIACVVALSGDAEYCTILQETPEDYGFGPAALRLVGAHKFRPYVLNGVLLGYAPIVVPVNFHAPPSAPSK